MSERLNPKNKRLFLLVSTVLFLDQLTKFLAESYLATSCNRGIAFGIEIGNSLSLIVSLIILAFLFHQLMFTEKGVRSFSLTLIFAGGFSNFLDRFFLGCVRDFINLSGFALWPAFNFADSAIILGSLVFLYSIIFRKIK